MDLRCFVKVLPDPAKISSGGTGYLISQDLVLTAAHVVEDADVVTVVYDPVEPESGPRPPLEKPERCRATVRWRGVENCDVALLALAAPVPFQVSSPRFVESGLDRLTPWESRGWAVAGEDEPMVRDSMVDLHGTASAFLPHQKRVQLTTEILTVAIDLWTGISGAPVFEGGAARRLLGVVVEAPENFKNVLEACPIADALRDEGFRRALGPKIAFERRQRLIHDVEGILGKPPRRAAEAISECRPSWERRFSTDGAVGLTAELLFSSDVGDVLVELNQAHQRLWATGGSDRAEARQVAAVVARIAPLLLQVGLLHALPDQSGGAFLRLPITTATVAELAVAGFDGRPSALRFREGEFPDGLGRLPLPHEVGFDVDGERALHAYSDHLEKSFLTPEDRDLLERLRKRPGGELAARERVFLLVDDELAFQAENGNQPMRRYLLYDDLFAKEHSGFLAELRRRMKSIHLVEMTGDDHPGERRISRPLRELLARDAAPAESER